MTAAELASGRGQPVTVFVAAQSPAWADSSLRAKPISHALSDDTFGQVYEDRALADAAAQARGWQVYTATVYPPRAVWT